MRREERERGWRGMRVPEEGKEAASPQLLLSQGLKLSGLSEANFLRGSEEKKKKEKINIMERNGRNTSQPGKLIFLSHLAKARRRWGINSSPCQ